MNINSFSNRYLVLFLFFILAVSGILSCRALYADGSFFLYQMLINGGLFVFDVHRSFAQYIVEWPVYLAVKLGVQDLNALMRIFSFGIIAIPIFFWFVALILQFKTAIFWLLVLAFSVTYLRSGFFAVGEFNTAYGLVALSISIILKKNISNFLNLILLLSSFILIYSYESMLFLGIILLIACCVRFTFDKNDNSLTKLTLIISGCFYIFASFVGFRSIFFSRNINLESTINYGGILEPYILYLIVMIFLAMFLFIDIKRTLKVTIVLFALFLTLLYVFYVIRWDKTGISYGYYNYGYRSLGAFMLAFLLCISCAAYFIPQLIKNNLIKIDIKLLSYIVGMIFIVQSSIMLFHTVSYYKWLKSFESVAMNIQGLVPIDKTKIGVGYSGVAGYNWPWTNSTLSVLLRGNAESIVTNASNFKGWETFDPNLIEKYPLANFKKLKPLFP